MRPSTNEFYSGCQQGDTGIQCKPMEFGSPKTEWSAHVFDDVVVVGFNSCFRNDKSWRGARIHHDAIMDAKNYIEARAKRHLLRVAVWHHGLGAGAPPAEDQLSLVDLGALHNAGFRIGLHGHTHRHAQENNEALFGDKFIVIAAGSIGAGSSERPDAVAINSTLWT